MAKKKKKSKKTKEERLLWEVKSTLLDFIETLEVSKEGFEKENIKIDNLSKILSSYLDSLNFIKDEKVLKVLNEKIKDIQFYAQDIKVYHSEIKLSIESIEKDYKVYIYSNKSSNIKKNIEFLNNITIKNFFSINEMTLTNLKDKKEIYIVGENGDGKTLLLQAIAVGLKGTVEDGLKEFRIREKEFDIEIENSEDIENNFFAYGSSRNNSCQLNEDTIGYLSLFSGEYDLKSPTKWLQYLDYSEQKENSNIITVAEAKKLLNHLLNSEIEIDISPKGVTFKEKDAPVSFDQLSAGYKGVITIICDLIARLSEKQQVENISDFQGVVLIDEVELHLHPKWQYGFMQKLRTTFPLIQFIVTTHSPTVILGAGSNDVVFYKIYKENGETKISQPMDNIKNLMANNLSTSPLFDMTTARARNSDDKLDTSDDYIYSKIHENIAKRVKGKKAIIEDDIVAMIDKELDDYIKEQGL